jgi:hypothetical protein
MTIATETARAQTIILATICHRYKDPKPVPARNRVLPEPLRTIDRRKQRPYDACLGRRRRRA